MRKGRVVIMGETDRGIITVRESAIIVGAAMMCLGIRFRRWVMPWPTVRGQPTE